MDLITTEPVLRNMKHTYSAANKSKKLPLSFLQKNRCKCRKLECEIKLNK